MELTVREIETAKPKSKQYKLADGKGLCLLVMPTGAKYWRWRYRFDGTEKMMWLGEYPGVGLKEARERLSEARKRWSSGIDPLAERKAEAEAKQNEVRERQREAESSFESVARDWWKWWLVGKSPRHAETVMLRLEADVLLL
jgi:Arm DNA-binding domain